MAIEYGAFIVDGVFVKQQTLSLTGQSTGLTNAAGFAAVQGGSESLVHALARVGPAGWALVNSYPDNTNQTLVLIFSRQQ
jgi:hypothetical protein